MPCPATMSTWSNGEMKIAPVCSAYSLARTIAWSRYWPWKITSAPYPLVALTFGIGAPSGMKIVDADAEQLRGHRHPLGVVAGRRRDDPAARSASESRDSRT